MAGINGWEPQEGAPVLMSRELFEEFVRLKEQAEGITLEVDYGMTIRGTITYCEPSATVIEDDPLTVGQ